MIDKKIDAAIEKHYSHPQKALFSTGARQSSKTFAICKNAHFLTS